ncbi:hypothetical protein EGJ15_10830 [Pseudomonas sp. p99-361]|nr:hypothetical protein FPB55_18070 [Pseudomonas sp. BJP69]RRV70575.1 hypothetical protein EGJ15_10830 [Pseudomonas sp. p99-361]
MSGPANTGSACAMQRAGFFAGLPAPTGIASGLAVVGQRALKRLGRATCGVSHSCPTCTGQNA